MPKTIFVISLFLLSIGSDAQNLGFKLEPGKSKVIIPVEVINNMVIVPVLLDKQIPLKFILDTGVRSTVLTQKIYSDMLGLTYSKTHSISGPGGEKLVDAYVTDNVTLDLPGVHGEGHSVLVLDKDYLELRNYLGTEVHGVLGYELFSRFIVQMDYERKRITLYLPSRFKKKASYQTLPIQVQDTKPFLLTPTRINATTQMETKLLIDTGASHGLILEPETDERIVIPEKNMKGVIGRGLGGVITGQIGRIHSLQLGKYNIEGIIANFPDPNSYTDTLFRKESLHRNGAIGGEIISRFKVIFNYSKEEIYLKKSTTFKKKFNYDMSGLTIRAKGARLRSFEITNLREDSPAAKAGLMTGDNILFVNGNPIYNMSLNSVNGFFNSRPGKRVSVEVERNGKRMKFEFYLVNQI